MVKKAVACGGAWMIAASLQVVPQLWPHVLAPHPWLIGLFVLIGAGMFVYAAIGHKQASGDNSGIQAERDNFGSNIVAGGDVWVAPPASKEQPPTVGGDLRLSISIHPTPSGISLADRSRRANAL